MNQGDRHFRNWLAGYERRRTGNLEGQNKEFFSSKWDLSSMSWAEIREIPIPSLGEQMTFGKSCEALRKSWYALKRGRAEGSYNDRDLQLRINRIQNALGLERTIFDPDNQEWIDHELAMEEQDEGLVEQPLEEGLVEQEDEENDEGLSPEEQQLNRRLKKEERSEMLASFGLEEVEGEEKRDEEW